MKLIIVKEMLCLIIILRTMIAVWSQSSQNAIAVLNGQVQFNCTSRPYSDFNWVKNLGGYGATRIASRCKIESSLTANYAVENGSNFCNLIVSNVNMHHAGTYTCVNAFKGTVTRVVLTVINPNANVTVLNSTTLTEDELVNISCSLAYNTSPSNLPRLIPTLSWMVPIGQIESALINDIKTNNVTSILTVMLQQPVLPIFECIVNFNLTGDLSDKFSTNIPSSPVTSWNTSMAYDLLYPARTCSITNETIVNSGICRLSNLSCVASANPPAKYRWVDVNDPQPWNSLNDTHVFPFAEDGRTYQCTAFNVIKGKERRNGCTFTVPNQSQSLEPCKFAHENAMDIYSTDSNCNNEVRSISCSCKNGTYANLVCNATNFFPKPTYRWEKEDGTFLGNGPSYNATLKGTIKCIALTAIPGVNANSSKGVKVTDCYEPVTTIGYLTTSQGLHNTSTRGSFPFLLTTIIAGVLVFLILLIVAIYRFRGNKYKATSETTQRNMPQSPLQDFSSSTENDNKPNSKPSKQHNTNSKTDPINPIYAEVTKHPKDPPQSNQNDLSSPLTSNLGGRGSPNHQQLHVSSPYAVEGTEYQEFRPNKEANITPKQFLVDANGGIYASLDKA